MTSRSDRLPDRLRKIREASRTVPSDKAMVASEYAIRSMGIDPARASSPTREQDAVLARCIVAGLLYRMCRMSYMAVGRKMGCGKATAQARIASFERLKERDVIIAKASEGLSKMACVKEWHER
jgi:hypothetical protein